MEEKENVRILLSNVGDMALKRRAKLILEELDAKKRMRILDCGCGDGFYLFAISQLDAKCELYGVDVEARSLQSAKINLSSFEIPLIRSDAAHLPFPDNFFDCIVMSEVLEHIEDDLKALREVRRVLKKGGRLLITVPNHSYPFLWDPLNKALEFFTGRHIKSGFWAGLWNQHLRLYYPDGIVGVVKESGFKVEKIEGATHYCLPFNHYILNALAILLYGGKLPSKIGNSISKFTATKHKKNALIRFGYWLVNQVDRLNKKTTIKDSTVSVFVKAVKSG